MQNHKQLSEKPKIQGVAKGGTATVLVVNIMRSPYVPVPAPSIKRIVGVFHRLRTILVNHVVGDIRDIMIEEIALKEGGQIGYYLRRYQGP